MPAPPLRLPNMDRLGSVPRVGHRVHLSPLALWFIANGREYGVPYRDMARFFGVTKSAICGAVRRRVMGKRDPYRVPHQQRSRPVHSTVRSRHGDEEFIEPYAARKLRLAAERAARLNGADA